MRKIVALLEYPPYLSKQNMYVYTLFAQTVYSKNVRIQ